MDNQSSSHNIVLEYWNKIKGFIAKDTGLGLTFMYLLMIVIGIIFNSAYFFTFRINIFDYAGIEDFLFAPLEDFWIPLFIIVTVILIWLIFKLDSLLQKSYPNMYIYNVLFIRKIKDPIKRNTWQKRIIIFTIIYYLLMSGLLYGIYKNNKIRSGKGRKIELIYKAESESFDTIQCNFIGKTANFLFYTIADSTSEPTILPIGEVHSIRHLHKKESDKNKHIKLNKGLKK